MTGNTNLGSKENLGSSEGSKVGLYDAAFLAAADRLVERIDKPPARGRRVELGRLGIGYLFMTEEQLTLRTYGNRSSDGFSRFTEVGVTRENGRVVNFYKETGLLNKGLILSSSITRQNHPPKKYNDGIGFLGKVGLLYRLHKVRGQLKS